MTGTGSKTYKIAIDAMGGDFAPESEIQGAILASREIDADIEMIFVGKESIIESTLAKKNHSGLKYSILNADQVVTMDDEPTTAIKTKKDSSLYQGLICHSEGKADAFLSAGNTGAVLSTATILLGRIKGVSRPTIGSFVPTNKELPTILLDVGANVDSKPKYLYEFAVMGSIYISQAYGVKNPSVALINIGEEKSKGGKVVLEAYEILSNSDLNFIGNIEGRDVLMGKADVVVCDGFTGNVILKFAESFPAFLKHRIKDFASKSIFHKAATATVVPLLRKVLSSFDYEEYGGVPLLGVNGSVIIGHGKSTPKAIKSMIFRSVDLVSKKVNNKIEKALKTEN